MEWVRARVPPGETVYVWAGLRPLAEVYLHQHRVIVIDEESQLPPVQPAKTIYFVNDRPAPVDGSVHTASFIRPRGRLWRIVRKRSFDASVVPVTSRLRFGSGWHGEETGDNGAWRWMQGDALLYVPAIAGRGRLLLQFFVPNDTLATPPTVTIHVNGAKVAEVVAQGDTLRQSFEVLSLPAGENEVRITTSAVVNPHQLRGDGDKRDLGLRLDAFSWTPIAR
jgi:hypothetical protein